MEVKAYPVEVTRYSIDVTKCEREHIIEFLEWRRRMGFIGDPTSARPTMLALLTRLKAAA